jgi:hypothetical protein
MVQQAIAIGPNVTLGSRMPPHRSLEERLAELELFQKEAKPMVEAYKAGQLVFKLAWLAGGLVIGAAALLKAWTWITSNFVK